MLVLPSLELMLRGRVLVAHNAAFDRRVLRQAFTRVGSSWPDPPTICTVALARSLLPLQRERRLAALADALGHRGPRQPPGARRRRNLRRGSSARCSRVCARTPAPSARRSRCWLPGDGPARHGGLAGVNGRSVTRRPHGSSSPACRATRASTSSAMATGRPLYVGKSVSIRTRARAHFAPSTQRAAWTQHAAIVDYEATCSELGALVVGEPSDQAVAPAGQRPPRAVDDDQLCYIRCRLDIPSRCWR